MKKVNLYSTVWCPYCKQEEAWLTEKGIDFKVVMVDSDPLAANYIAEKTHQNAVPVTEIMFDDGRAEYVIGFDRAKLTTLLDI